MGIFKKLTYITLGLAVIGLGIGLLGYQAIFSINTKITDDYQLYIPTGSTYDDVQSRLVTDDVIKNSSTFDLVAGLMNYENIKPGKYIIKPNTSNRHIIQKLRGGQQEAVKVTISQARYISDVAGKVAKVIEADSVELLTALTDTAFLAKEGLGEEDAVGLIIPNTYEMYWASSAEDFRNRMKREYDKYWSSKDRDTKRKAINMTRAEVSALAAIVEKESNLKAERPTIAGVYLNRIQRDIPLQADPTVVYAVGDFSIRRVLNKHLEYDSPYNTYKYPGIPPGPICMPSQSAIDAVLNADKHDYIFFCAKPGYDGAHSFAKTNAQHLRNARIYHRWLTKEGIMR